MNSLTDQPSNVSDAPVAAATDTMTPAPAPLIPHPLELNENEGRWMHYVVGPVDGWFCFGEHGNPPFETPVQVCYTNLRTGRPLFSAVGTRTRELIPVLKHPTGVQELWRIESQFPGRADIGMTHWRFLSGPFGPLPRVQRTWWRRLLRL